MDNVTGTTLVTTATSSGMSSTSSSSSSSKKSKNEANVIASGSGESSSASSTTNNKSRNKIKQKAKREREREREKEKEKEKQKEEEEEEFEKQSDSRVPHIGSAAAAVSAVVSHAVTTAGLSHGHASSMGYGSRGNNRRNKKDFNTSASGESQNHGRIIILLHTGPVVVSEIVPPKDPENIPKYILYRLEYSYRLYILAMRNML